MNRILQATSPLLALAALLGACAQTPEAPATQVAALDCAALQAEVSAAEHAARLAAQQQHDAWKAVVPFAVMARYGQGKAAANESQQRLAELQQHAALRGCAIPTH
jgi:hypothetical protein